MIAAELRDGRAIQWAAGKWTIESGEIPASFTEPVVIIDFVERIENGTPVQERTQVKVEPGAAPHARQVLVDAGATIILDDGDA